MTLSLPKFQVQGLFPDKNAVSTHITGNDVDVPGADEFLTCLNQSLKEGSA